MRDEISMHISASDEPSRFLPYVQMHEVEALLFVDPKIMAEALERPELEARFAQVLQKRGECEETNEHPATAPSKRIEAICSSYRKGSGIRAHAPIIVKNPGVERLREACPHLNDWVTRLEGIAHT
jgi:hypothetical protein